MKLENRTHESGSLVGTVRAWAAKPWERRVPFRFDLHSKSHSRFKFQCITVKYVFPDAEVSKKKCDAAELDAWCKGALA